jgi:hypothetical protein
MNNLRRLIRRLGGLSALLCLTLAQPLAGADSVFIYPEDAPIAVECLVEGNVVNITLTNLSSQPIGEFMVSHHSVFGCSLIATSSGGQPLSPVWSESESSGVYAGLHSHRWVFISPTQEATITLSSVAHPSNVTHYFVVEPAAAFGVIIPEDPGGCCEGRVGDANLAGGDEPTISDISYLIDCLFINVRPVDCPAEADLNQSGGANPALSDITLSDISRLIDYLYITGAEAMTLPPCP